MTLGSFGSVYVFEGLDGKQSNGAWALLALSGIVCILGLVSIGFNIYHLCSNGKNSAKISPEKKTKDV